MFKLVTFLGNPGNQYGQTRHNAGWMIADHLTIVSEWDWQSKFKGKWCQKTVAGEKFYFLKPETFMNKSGESVLALKQFFKLAPEEILVVYDDIELEYGFVGFKKGGGLAGHNGLRSISNVLSTRDFYRFRIGVSRPNRGDVSSYVLSKFSTDEQIVLPSFLEKSAALLENCLAEGIEKYVKKYAKYKLI